MDQLTVKDYGRKLETVPQAELKTKWDTQEMGRDFIVHAFAAPYIIVTRKSDNVRGSLEFTHNPRVYFNFKEG